MEFKVCEPCALDGRDDLTVVCAPADQPSAFTDDVFGTCAFCDGPVRFRPTAPVPSRKVCLGCYLSRLRTAEDVVHVTSRTMTEALSVLAPKGVH